MPTDIGSGQGGWWARNFGGWLADGGPVEPGKYYTVGERGPETFVPTAPGHIVPNGGGLGGLGGMGGGGLGLGGMGGGGVRPVGLGGGGMQMPRWGGGGGFGGGLGGMQMPRFLGGGGLGGLGGGGVRPGGLGGGGMQMPRWGGGGGFGGGRADGGPVEPGQYYTVGERGPETFVPAVPGHIVPEGARTIPDRNAPAWEGARTIPDPMDWATSRQRIMDWERDFFGGRKLRR
jgi:hypothetical protein